MIRTQKPWGFEDLLEFNSYYVLKKLFMMKDHCCSLQYHEEKHETIYVLCGILKLTIGTLTNLKELTLKERDYYAIEPRIVHRAQGVTDCLYLEASTNQLDDVVRIEDNYGRV
jgi:mannose-6-phosphate isomerase-like protein (cupin superfamily)